MTSTIFWDITPCSPLKVNRRFEGTYRLHLHGRKKKASKKPAWKQVAVDFQRTTRRYIPEDSTPHNRKIVRLSFISDPQNRLIHFDKMWYWKTYWAKLISIIISLNKIFILHSPEINFSKMALRTKLKLAVYNIFVYTCIYIYIYVCVCVCVCVCV
jgi:hypothetical protein